MEPLILIGILFLVEAIGLVFLRRIGKVTSVPPAIPIISALSGIGLILFGLWV